MRTSVVILKHNRRSDRERINTKKFERTAPVVTNLVLYVLQEHLGQFQENYRHWAHATSSIDLRPPKPSQIINVPRIKVIKKKKKHSTKDDASSEEEEDEGKVTHKQVSDTEIIRGPRGLDGYLTRPGKAKVPHPEYELIEIVPPGVLPGWRPSPMQIFDNTLEIFTTPHDMYYHVMDSETRVAEVPRDFLPIMQHPEYPFQVEPDPDRPGSSEFLDPEDTSVDLELQGSGVKEIIARLLEGEDREEVEEEDRMERAKILISQKERWQILRAQAVATGNQYYRAWETLQEVYREEAISQYRYDLNLMEYFMEMKGFDEGWKFARPRPQRLMAHSKTTWNRGAGHTPPEAVEFDDIEWVDARPIPKYLPTYFDVFFRQPAMTRRLLAGRKKVPRGQFILYYDVGDNDDWHRMEEFEEDPRFWNGTIPMGVEEYAAMLAEDGDYCPATIPIMCVLPWHLPGYGTPPYEFSDDYEFIRVEDRFKKIDLDVLRPLSWTKKDLDAYQKRITGRRDLETFTYSLLTDTNIFVMTRNDEPYGRNYDAELETTVEAYLPNHMVNYGSGPRAQANFRFFFDVEMEYYKWKYLRRRKWDETWANYHAIQIKYKTMLIDYFPVEARPPKVEVVIHDKVIVAVCQMFCTDDKEMNLEEAVRFMKNAKDRGAKMIFYPEAFDFIALTKEETVGLAERLDGPTILRYKELALQHDMWVSLGGFHELHDDLKEDGTPWLTNDHIMISNKGDIMGIYRKMHLFDVNIPEKKLCLQESGYIRRGNKLVIVEGTPIGNIALGICYDLRFPEFAMACRAQGADVLTYPSAFTAHTGKFHWESLLRARAIENQCFVIAPAQSGDHNAKRSTWGHSMIIDPWGEILAGCDKGSGVIHAELHLKHVGRIREEMPVISHRSPELAGIYTPSQFWIPREEWDEEDFPFGQVKIKYRNAFLESNYSVGFVNRKCVVPGHVLVISRRIVRRMQELSSVEVADLFVLVQKVQQIVESIHEASSSTLAVQDGEEAGQTIKHVHVHVVPRKRGDFPDNDTIYEELANHDKGTDINWRDESEMKEESYLIRQHIRDNFFKSLGPTPSSRSLTFPQHQS